MSNLLNFKSFFKFLSRNRAYPTGRVYKEVGNNIQYLGDTDLDSRCVWPCDL